MDYYVERRKVSNVKQRNGYQEIFFYRKTIFGKKSIKIRNCPFSIEEKIKKGLFRKSSVVEIHYLYSYPINIYLDKECIQSLSKADYPSSLKDIICIARQKEATFKQKFEKFVMSYPDKGANLEYAIYKIKHKWLRTCAGSLYHKVGRKENARKKLSLLIDLLQYIDKKEQTYHYVHEWEILYLENKNYAKLVKDSYSATIKYIQSLGIEKIAGYEELILLYLNCLLLELQEAYSKDEHQIESIRFKEARLLNNPKVDKYFLLQHSNELFFMKKRGDVPNYLQDELLTQADIRKYLEENA